MHISKEIKHMLILKLGSCTMVYKLLFYVFVCLPQIVLYQNNDPSFLGDPVHLVLTGLFFLGVLAFVFYIVRYVLNFLKVRQLNFTKGLPEFLLIFFCFCGAIPINDINSTDMNGFSSDIDYKNFCLNLTLTTIVFSILRQEARKILFPVICLIATVLFISNQYIFVTQKNKYLQNIQLGTTNTIVFSFDGIPGRIFNKLSTLPEQAEKFNDFVLYSNTFSHSPATLASMHSEIFGDKNWKLLSDTEDDLILFAQSELKQKKYGFLSSGTTYGYYNLFSLNRDNNLNEGFVNSNYNYIQSLPIISSSFCRMGICILGKYGWFINYVRKFKFLDGFIARSPMESRYTTWVDAIGTADKFKVDTKNKYGAFWGHYMFSHHPIWQNEFCEFGEKFDRPQVSAVVNQTKCIILVINTVLDALRKYEFYEDSLIVFKSDHGKPRQYYSRDSLYSAKINNHPRMGFDRYKPFAMIKFPHANRKTLTVDSGPFFISDLSLIYCRQWIHAMGLVEDNCAEASTEFDIDHVDHVDHQKYFFIPKSSASSYLYDTQDAYPVKPTVEAIEQLFKSLSDLN